MALEPVLSWTAVVASFDRAHDGTETLGLADTPAGDGRVLIVSRDPSDDDGYCLVDEHAATHYGGVTAWSLEGDALVIELDAEAARVFGGDRFELALSASVDRRHVAESLARLVG